MSFEKHSEDLATKQVIVIRKDLKMRRGKECAQAAHACSQWLINKIKNRIEFSSFSDAEKMWINGDYTKITVTVENEDELNGIYNAALNANLTVHIVTDLGKTEFDNIATKTCLAIGPDLSFLIDPITKNLKLY